MGTTGILFFVLLLIIEYRVFAGLIYYIRSFLQRKLPSMSQNGEIDDDVNEEKRRVKGMTLNDLETNNLVLQSLSKFYGKFLAVNQISIGIKRYANTNQVNKFNIILKFIIFSYRQS